MNLKELNELEGQKRVLLLQSKDEVDLHNQRELFDRSPKSYQDRDLVIVTGLEDDVIEKYEMNSEFDLVLIGKDGGVKYRAHGVANPDKIYSIIDQMPSRQKEMRPN
ncbi:MAG: DUF4174 domain-containing protein [Bacteriovoracaceae bacterium]|nr:DUF4174 domain-containing protein [Bacteriovoracaceae bacterium]